jgi:putative transposase
MHQLSRTPTIPVFSQQVPKRRVVQHRLGQQLLQPPVLIFEQLRELAAERRRSGYRRLGWMLAREGHAMNHKKLYRLYREEQLMARRRRKGRKRALGTGAPMTLTIRIKQRRSLDFVADALSDKGASAAGLYL